MEILTYPSYLANDEYALRKVTFTAMKNDACDTEVGQMLQKALSTAQDAAASTWNSLTNGNAPAAPEGFTSMGQIVLPIPAQLNDESSHSWNAETGLIATALQPALGAAGSLLRSKMDSKFGDSARYNNYMDKAGRIGSTVSNAVSAMGGLDKVLATGAMLAGRRKPLIDPGYFQNYSGTQPRTFMMQWVLIPQNSDEARTIHQIITTFKRWSSPSRAIAGVVMLAPYFFNIQLSNPLITSMIKMDNCVCNRVECSYSSQIFPDGMPKQINLSLGFSEARLTYADNYGSAVGSSAGQPSSAAPRLDVPKVEDSPRITPVNR